MTADRSYLTRLRTSEGPSHLLLVLLNQHRVMTTGQLARATGAPERTVRYRLDRLRKARLVDCARPGRETGSAPRHWWLRPAGARLVSGTAAAQGKPTAMFAAHAAAITELWLAFTEHGPAVGIELADWLADRAGWQEWSGTGRYGYGSRRYRLTPDAVATATLTGGGTAVAFIEVDLATMTQTLLKEKLARYLAYADDMAWQDVFPHCPPLLLLTTTATRAATFARAARQLLDRERRPRDADPAGELVIAACGLVRDPTRAIVEPCWMLPDSAAELTLAELLSERVEAQSASEAWHHYNDTVVRRRAEIDKLDTARRLYNLAKYLGSEPAAEVLHHLIGANPGAFLDTEPDLAQQVVDWIRVRRTTNRFQALDHTQPLAATLEARHAAIWEEQARRLLAAHEHLAAAHPNVHQLAEILADCHLAKRYQVEALNTAPTCSHEQLQRDALGNYYQRRDATIDATWRALSWRERRRTSREELAAAHDDEHLLICGTCEIIQLTLSADEHAWRCPHCSTDLLTWPKRRQVITLTHRIDMLRRHLKPGPC
ncbi:MAG: replication-relaxation family protein [Micromonosporaceae bacterium]